MTLIYHNYHFFLWLALSLIPAAVYRVRRLSRKELTLAERTGFFLMITAASLVWSNGLFLLSDHLPFSRAVQGAAFAVGSIAVGLVIGPLCYALVRLFRKAAHVSFFYDNRMFFALSVLWGVRLLTGEKVADALSMWHASSYVVNYTYGFASRFLAGSILRLFAGDFVSEREIYWFCFAVYVLLILLCSALLNRFYKTVPQSDQPAALFGIACFMCCPGSIAAMWESGNFGKLEVYGLLCALVGVILFRKIRSVPLRYLCLTVCACAAIMFYQGFVFLHFSILATVMIADVEQAEEGKARRRRLGFAALAAAATCVCFLCFQFFAAPSFANLQETYAEPRRHTDISMGKKAIDFEYFLPLREAYTLVTAALHDTHRRFDLLLELLLLSPLLFALAYAVLRYNRGNKKPRELLNGFNLSLLTVLFIIPQFLLNVDWGRWLTAMTVDTAFIFAYRLYIGDEKLAQLAKDLSERLRKNPAPYVLLILYLHMLSVFSVESPSEDDASLIQFAFRIAGVVKAVLARLSLV